MYVLCDMALDALSQAKLRLNKAFIHIKKESAQAFIEKLNKIEDDKQRFRMVESDRKPIEHEMHNFFREVHSFVTCHANINKLLFFGKEEKKNLKKHLRETGRNVSDDEICLIQDDHKKLIKLLKIDSLETFSTKKRDLRNDLEHIYNHIYTLYVLGQDPSNFRVCRSDELDDTAIGKTQENYLRTVVIDTMEYMVVGKTYNLDLMQQDIFKLRKRAKKLDPFSMENFFGEC